MSGFGARIGPDSAFYRVVSTWVAIVYVGVVWLLASLPVITAGPATYALFAAIRRLREDGETPRVRTFVQDMRAGWWTGLGLGIATLCSGVVLAVVVFRLVETGPARWALVLVIPVALFWAMTAVWVYPVAARDRLDSGRAVKVAYLKAVRRPIAAIASCACVLGAVLAPWLAPKPVALLVVLSTVGGAAWLITQFSEPRAAQAAPPPEPAARSVRRERPPARQTEQTRQARHELEHAGYSERSSISTRSRS